MLGGTEMAVSTRAWAGKMNEKTKIHGGIMGMGMDWFGANGTIFERKDGRRTVHMKHAFYFLFFFSAIFWESFAEANIIALLFTLCMYARYPSPPLVAPLYMRTCTR